MVDMSGQARCRLARTQHATCFKVRSNALSAVTAEFGHHGVVARQGAIEIGDADKDVREHGGIPWRVIS